MIHPLLDLDSIKIVYVDIVHKYYILSLTDSCKLYIHLYSTMSSSGPMLREYIYCTYRLHKNKSPLGIL